MNTPEKTPSFSIVLAVQDQAEALQGYLSRLLNDQQPTAGGQPVPDFQVIVVDESSTDNTTDLLSSLRADHPRLYSTFVPRYHFQRNPRRLAFTIGMKAAKCEWVIFADVDGFLPSETWLAELTEFAKGKLAQ